MIRKSPVPPTEIVIPAVIGKRDAPALESITGREDDQGAEPGALNAVDIRKPVGGVPRSAVTGKDQPGMHDDETDEGLTDSEELLRQSAEAAPADRQREKDVPAFDRGHDMPKA